MRNNILPNVYDFLLKQIQESLNNCDYLCLVADLWSNSVREDYMGLAALISISKIKHLIVIGFERMEQTSHTADSIKSKIDQILSKYDFDRKKIIGIMCDQGSNFVSAFKSPPITSKEGI